MHYVSEEEDQSAQAATDHGVRDLKLTTVAQCDLEKPTCRRCAIGKRECLGYEQQSVFINVNPRRTQHQLRLEETRSRSAPLPLRSASSSAAEEAASEASIEESAVGEPMPLFPCHPNRLNPQLSVAGQLDTNFLGLFFNDFVPSNPRARSNGYPWLQSIMKLNAIGAKPVLKLSLRALCMTRVARLRGDEVLVKEGHVTYGNALKAIQYALWSERDMLTDDTMAAACCLEMFEVSWNHSSANGAADCVVVQLFESAKDSPNGWVSHQSGMEQMVLSRGPHKYRELTESGIIGNVQYSSVSSERSLHCPRWRRNTHPWPCR